jgi:ABC-type nitrate/sulfonate/bicarbonate transport system substrate-binding protein
MTRYKVQLIAGLFLIAACTLPASTHAAQPKKLRLVFSAFAYANPPIWIAHELKLFEKHGGYETELIYVGGSPPIQAMLGGLIDVSQVGGAAAGAAANGVRH